jgi:hypothetical protein
MCGASFQKAGLLVCAILVAVGSFARIGRADFVDQITDSQLREMVGQQARIVAKGLSISPSFEIVAGDGYWSSPDYGIKIGIKELRSNFRMVPENALPLMVRWIVAHEFWHQIQYRDRGKNALEGDDDTKRVLECEADLMASRLVYSTAMNIMQDGVGDYVLDIPNIISPTGESGTHPSSEQRTLTVIYGLLRVQFDLNERSPQDKEQASVRAGLREMIDLRGGESDGSWRERECKKITQYPRSSITELNVSSAKISKPNGSGFRDFRIIYRNAGDSTLSVSLSLFAAQYGHGIISRRTYFFPMLGLSRAFDIAPGGEYVVDGRFPTLAADGSEIALVYQPEKIAVTVAAIPGSKRFPFDIELPNTDGLSSGAKSLGEDIIRFSKDAESGFRTFAECEWFNDYYCRSKHNVFGAKETSISIRPGTKEVRASLYAGLSRSAALAIYSKYVGFVKSLWPYTRVEEEVGASPSVEVSLARKLRLSVYMLEDRDDQEAPFRVVLELKASTF